MLSTLRTKAALLATVALLGLVSSPTLASAATVPAVKNGDLTYLEGFSGIVLHTPGQDYNRALAEGDEPRFSPDGRQVAYYKGVAYPGHVQREVFVHDLKTNRPRQVTTNANAESLDWSPDGKKIVFSEGNQLKVVDIASFSTTTAYTASTPVKQPAWAPDGSRIAFSTGSAIMLVTPQGTGLRTLTTGGTNTRPDWRPDSKALAFITTRFTGKSEIVTLPRTGNGTPFRVSHTAYPQGLHHIGVAWSPDGKKIAVLQFNANHEPNDQDTDERYKVRAYLPDGSHSYSLTGPIVGDDGPEGLDWAPKVTLR